MSETGPREFTQDVTWAFEISAWTVLTISGMLSATSTGPQTEVFWMDPNWYRADTFAYGVAQATLGQASTSASRAGAGITQEPLSFTVYSSVKPTAATLTLKLVAHAEEHVGAIAAVPEPATSALMLAGLGVLGVVARRGKH